MSCALWLRNYALRPIIIEKESVLGGMAERSPYPDEGLLGRPNETCCENARAFARHIRQVSIETWLEARPQRIRRGPEGNFELHVATARTQAPAALSAAALVIATGTRFRGAEWLDRVANARRLADAGRVHVGAPWAGQAHAGAGQRVAVVGGGDNAFDVSRMLAERGVRVTIVMRSSSPRASPWMLERLRRHESSGMAQVLSERTVQALDDSGSRICMSLNAGERIEVDHLILLFGYRPNTDEPWVAELAMERDAQGYIAVDGNMESSCDGAFAIGDVANPRHPSIATAIGSGTKAAREIAHRLYPRSDRLR
jgi:thioredoxin reductase